MKGVSRTAWLVIILVVLVLAVVAFGKTLRLGFGLY